MDSSLILTIILGFSALAFLYASVGHGGASGYIALFILLGFTPLEIKIPVLILNALVASISAIQFTRLGFFKLKPFLSLILLSVPMAYLGSRIGIKESWLNVILMLFLWYSAWVLWKGKTDWRFPVGQKWGLILIGGGLGWLSGMLGIGGGILLTPILMASKWGNSKEVSAQSSWFIVVNSLGGLAATSLPEIQNQTQAFWMIFPIVLVCGFLGARWGSLKSKEHQLKRIMSIVLALASLKLLFQTIGI
jgi:uncharacterized membrane protein YfcA